MRASRLLAMMLLLQNRGRMTAQALAEDLARFNAGEAILARREGLSGLGFELAAPISSERRRRRVRHRRLVDALHVAARR